VFLLAEYFTTGAIRKKGGKNINEEIRIQKSPLVNRNELY